ncbi:MAG: hypothetical protein D6820_14760 [Lentisphaerae bacterium]|nr:MAG: hypothetical protein D6820_14760 [Lentisphaerota bacterium]
MPLDESLHRSLYLSKLIEIFDKSSIQRRNRFDNTNLASESRRMISSGENLSEPMRMETKE